MNQQGKRLPKKNMEKENKTFKYSDQATSADIFIKLLLISLTFPSRLVRE